MLVPVTGTVHQNPQEWFDATRPSRRLLARLRRRTWPLYSPKFTVIMPVYNVREEWLRAAVESVIAQTYPHWQMICVNDNSTAPHIRPTLDELSARDRRIRVIHCATNCGVSVATNLAVAQATGEYIVFLDHDDYLEPHALHRFAEVVMHDNPDMIYSDEVMTHPDIDRVIAAACRSSFSYDYFLSHPYFVHLIAARTEIVHKIGGLNEEMTISQDVDFVLRLLEACRDITHVPEVLYRWRTHPGSLGHQQQDKVYAMTRGALERHFDRIGLAVDFDDKTHFNFRDLKFALTAAPPRDRDRDSHQRRARPTEVVPYQSGIHGAARACGNRDPGPIVRRQGGTIRGHGYAHAPSARPVRTRAQFCGSHEPRCSREQGRDPLPFPPR